MNRTPTPRHPGLLRRHWILAFLSAAILLAGALTVIAPGYVRLAILQPVRDLMFFERELEPFEHHAEIVWHRPTPDATAELPADPQDVTDVSLGFDLWIPAIYPAPVALLLHGASPRGRKLGFNMLLGERLRDAGWLVISADARGFGGSGTPRNLADPASWSVTRDLARLISYAKQHPNGNGTVVAVGHSMGGSQLLQLESAGQLVAIALVGPSREADDKKPTWGQRVRFSSDRKIARVLPAEIATTSRSENDILRFAKERAELFSGIPVLLMDGSREGERLVNVLREAAELMGTNAMHLTIAGSHHYCGAYQLPWPASTVFVRPKIFNSCFEPLEEFLAGAVQVQ